MHTHAAYCTAYGASGQSLGAVISEMGMLAPGDIPLVPYCPPGSGELAQQTAEALREANGSNIVSRTNRCSAGVNRRTV